MADFRLRSNYGVTPAFAEGFRLRSNFGEASRRAKEDRRKDFRRSVDGGQWSVLPLLSALSFYLPCVWQAEL